MASACAAVSPSKEIKIVSAVRRSSMSSCGSSGYFSSSPTLSSSPPVLCNPKSVLKRPVTSEELLTPGAPYARKTFTIVGDAVGWGFVVRGSKPCHIQAVDPSGPAAAAGMKFCVERVPAGGELGSRPGSAGPQPTGSEKVRVPCGSAPVSSFLERQPYYLGSFRN
uniref:DEP domain containing MTOR interacting protein n=1 Tax=Molossus molossus TaxID=27622 RepID=A0A7J8DSW5_MOLMO|nr:DEP domain containing MTOR interacting protein [Molossus molossus]